MISQRLTSDIEQLAVQIYDAASRTFNINSPQQLGKVLFEDLGLPAPVKYGKGKVISTAADVLEALAPEYPIAQLVLDYRQLTKLKGTYVDALPALIDPATGRLHTTFNQTGAATGRLSSSNPNLQNIPIRTELGREIRAAFVPDAGLEADRRRLFANRTAPAGAYVAGSGAGRSVHATARTSTRARRRKCFDVAPLMVTPDMRRAPKPSTSASSTARRRSVCAATGHRSRRKRSCTSAVTSSAMRRPRVHRPHHRRGAQSRHRENAVRPQPPDSRHAQP